MHKPDFKVYVGIPAYNAEKTISDVIERTRKINLVYKIIVIDDGSKDDTKGIVKKYKDVILIVHDANRGYGGTQKHLFTKFLELSKSSVLANHVLQRYRLMLMRPWHHACQEEVHLYNNDYDDD